MSQMTPREIVHELGRHIIGQDKAKKAVAIALRKPLAQNAAGQRAPRRGSPQKIF